MSSEPIPPAPNHLLKLLLAGASVGLLAILMTFPFEEIQYWGWDISVFRAGSKSLLHGSNPYLPENVVRYSDGAELASVPNYVYAPYFAILIAPITYLAPAPSARIWFVINLVAYGASVILLLRTLRWIPEPREFLLIILGMAAFPPLRTLLVIGQSSGIMLLLLVMAFWLIRRSKQIAAGAFLGLALFKPHLFLVPLFLAQRRLWKVIVALLATILISMLPFWNLLDDWAIAMVQTRLENLGNGCLAFSSLSALIGCFANFQSVQAIASLAMVVLGYWFIRERSRPESSLFALQLGLVVALGLLVIDNVRVADLILLVLPFVVAISHLPRVRSVQLRRGAIALLIAAYLFPYLAQIFGWVTHRPLLFSMPIWYASMPIAVFSATALLMVDRMRILKD